jgi:methylmalonyl-CoA/ethylmalonyl-CoA epimerase
MMTLKLNHIGVVVQDIGESIEIFQTLGLCQATHPEPDPIQRVSAVFISAGNEGSVSIELLQPLDDQSPVSKFLTQRGGGLHHLCFEVDDIEETTEALRKRGLKMVRPPVECVGYDRSFGLGGTKPTRIAFFLLANKLLIELLQKGT